MSFFDDMREHYSEQPHEVSLETQAVCNARCTFCPYPTIDRKGVKMSDELIDRLVGEMATFKKPFYFSPFKLSDPLLDKRMLPLCERMNREVPNAYIRMFTNGSALTDKHIQGIANLKRIVHLWISLNEVDAESYEALMGLNFEHTAKNLDHLHVAVIKEQFRHPVVVSRVGGNLDERDEFVAYVRNRWPRFRPQIIRRDAWIDFTNSDCLEVPERPCGRWWELNITSTGKASLCCMADGDKPEHIVGDVNSQTLLEIYNSPGRQEVRARNDRSGVPLCETCSYG